jgi:hypothetical protein
MPKQGAGLIRTNVFLSVAERDGLKRIARRQGISAAEVTRRVLDSFLGIPAAPVEPITFKRGMSRHY